MNYPLDFSLHTLRQIRQNCLAIADRHDPAALQLIPPGFNNNLIWNLGHILVTQQLLHYGLAKQALRIPKEWVSKYRKGTRPKGTVPQAEIDAIRRALETTVDELEQDLQTPLFDGYEPYRTSTGVTLSNIREALLFNHMHEGIHLGSMLAIRKFL